MRQSLRLPLDMDGAVWFHQRIPYDFPMHSHSELEVNLVVRGTARYLFPDRRFDLRPGTQVWMFPAQEHVLVERSHDLRLWVAVFRPKLVRRACTSLETAMLRKSDPHAYFCRDIRPTDARMMGELCGQLAKETDPAALNAGLGWLMISSWAAYRAAEQPALGRPVHPAVERAARLVRDETDATMKIDELARRCGLSPSRLSRLFKQQTGVALVAYRQQKRLERFFELYRPSRAEGGAAGETDGNLLSTALRAGFGSYPQFHRVFKQATHMSPSEYRRQQQNISRHGRDAHADRALP